MKTNKLISFLSIALLIFLLVCSSQAVAGYLVEYTPYPFPGDGCQPCQGYAPHHYYHHYYSHHTSRHKHYSRRRSHYSIQVYYTYVPYPDYYSACGCYSCQRCGCTPPPRQATCNNGDYSTTPARYVRSCSNCRDMSYDTSTADDTYEY